MNRFAIFHKVTGTLIAQGVSAGEPGYNPDLATRVWLGEGHEVHGDCCLVGGELVLRQQWGAGPVNLTGQSGEYTVTGLPASSHVRIDPDGLTEFERAYAVSNAQGGVVLDLPSGAYRLTLEGQWKGLFGRLTLS